jgi:hypothetical protein
MLESSLAACQYPGQRPRLFGAGTTTTEMSYQPWGTILADMSALPSLHRLHTAAFSTPSFSSHRSQIVRLGKSLRLLIVLSALLPSLAPWTAVAHDDELAGLTVVPIDAAAAPEAIMRLRPFIIGAGATASFSRDTSPIPLSDGDGQLRLGELLDGRGVAPAQRAVALDRYDDAAVRTIVPAPSLRVALLMMVGWKPYEAVVAALLNDANPSRKPVDRIDFGPTDPTGAIATDVERNGQTTITVNEAYAAEPPEQLMSVLVHESLHGDRNSADEEVAANLLDALAYADVLLAFPGVASVGTELAAFNNATLLALLNSTGRGGPTRLGIEDTLLGDVWLGPYLEEIDATSFRASVTGDEIYDGLAAGGSPGRQTLTSLIARFPGAADLGPSPAFGDPLLTVLDRGIGEVIPPRDAVTLAETLGLDAIGDVREAPAPLTIPVDPETAFGDRPFVPLETSLFDPRRAVVPSQAIGEAGARTVLIDALDQSQASNARRATTLRRFADPAFRRQVPAPSVRAAALLLDGLQPWDRSFDTLLRGGTGVIFGDLPYAVPVARRLADDGHPVIILSRDLTNEQPALLASYVIEGTLLPVASERHPATAGDTVAVALLGTLAYADLLRETPDVVNAATPATIERNRELLALLNSAGGADANDRVAFLGTVARVNDVLPGLHADATSFSEFVGHQRRLDGASGDASRFTGSPLWRSYLGAAKVPLDPDRQLTGPEALSLLDHYLTAFLSPADLRGVARTLDLGVAAPTSSGAVTAP